MDTKIVYSNNIKKEIHTLLEELGNPNYLVVCDTNTIKLFKSLGLDKKNTITIIDGEEHKNIDSVKLIWDELESRKFTRYDVVINLGGGMITDLGGFAASTYMRGIKYINIPTTLLSAVDASVGGKTGINYNNMKNHIGVFSNPYATIISTIFFDTLSTEDLLSGFGEMLKHSLLIGEDKFKETMQYNILNHNPNTLLDKIKENIDFKKSITEQDYKEFNIRKILNLGHTVGHAIESNELYKNGTTIPHGYCVVYGMLIEMILSNIVHQYPNISLIKEFSKFVEENYNKYSITESDKDKLIDFMNRDKKNNNNKKITFVTKNPENTIFETDDEIMIYQALDTYEQIVK